MDTPVNPAPVSLLLRVLPEPLLVCRLGAVVPVPAWAMAGEWWSVGRSSTELSVICAAGLVPDGVPRTGPWLALVVDGPLDHALIGILASIADPLAAARVPIIAVSTYQTDAVLVPELRLADARRALAQAGHRLEG